MSRKRKILTIDDNKLIHTLVRKTIGDEYELISALDGVDGIQKAIFESPDIILLDVEMPCMSGYEVCSSLKGSEDTRDIPVIFLSSLSDDASRIKGFDVGAIDFLVKPFEAAELIAKFSSLCSYLDSQESLSEQAESAQCAAFTAMRGTSDLGMAIHFIEASYDINEYESLAKVFFGVTNNLELQCSLLFNLDGDYQFYACSGDVCPLEKDIISNIYEKGERFTDFSDCRTQINYAHVALLIKNMPVDDEDKYGRFKDFLPTMLGSTDAKVHSIINERAVAKQTKNLGLSFDAVQDTLNHVGVSLEKNQTDVVKLLSDMLAEFEYRIPGMGLDDDQETYLINRLDTTMTKAYTIVDNSRQTSHAFKTVSRLLEHLSTKQEKLMESMERAEKSSNHEAKSANEDVGDVELF